MCLCRHVFDVCYVVQQSNGYSEGPNKRGGRIKSIACKNIDFLIRVLACNKSIACKAKSSTVDKRCGARGGSIFHRYKIILVSEADPPGLYLDKRIEQEQNECERNSGLVSQNGKKKQKRIIKNSM